MSLRIQLLGLGLLTLALPWAGYRYVQELEAALRAGLEQALLASASTIAAALRDAPLGEQPAAGPRSPQDTVYAPPLASAPALDGYRNDWSSADASARAIGTAGRYWTGVHDRSLYVFLTFDDTALVYQSAPTQLPYGDRVVLTPRGADDTDWLLLHTTGPGPVRPQRTRRPEFTPSGQYEDRALAYWRGTSSGLAVELRVPLDLVGDRLGLAVIDVDPAPGAPADSPSPAYAVEMTSTWPIESQPPPHLLYRPAALAALGRRFEQPGKRLRIVDRDGWVLFDGGAIDPLERSFTQPTLGIAERILRLILARGDPPYTGLEHPTGFLGDPYLRAQMSGTGGVAWYARGTAASAVVVAVTPIGGDVARGAILLEQGSDAILTLTNEALVELMSFTLIASLLVGAGLLSYATYLSMRVRRLARAADTAMGPKGDIEPKLPGHHARDEIGDLARSFTALLRRLRDHTDYLTTLKGKLAHELRTPLAVVATSLENVEREPHGDHLAPYLARLREGTDRLDSILGSMSEATALEKAVTAMEREPFALDAVVRGCLDGYRDVYPDRRFDYSSQAASSTVLGSPDLVAQMLDKLIDNAVSFSEARTTVAVALEETERELRLSVSNAGPPLPAEMRESLFDSLVSVRAPDARRGHLGLGLYIVALIAEFHGGSVRAEDLPDGSGVVFTATFPKIQ